MGYSYNINNSTSTHNHNTKINHYNNNNNNNNYNNDNNYDTIVINEEFKNIPLNNFDEIQIKNDQHFSNNYNHIPIDKNHSNHNQTPSDKYSIIIFRDLITNKFNDSLPLLLSTIIENPIQYSNLIDTINHLKLKSSSKLSESLHNAFYLLSFLIIFIITILLLLLLPFNIYYYFWTIIFIPIIFIIYYIDQYLKIKSIKNFIIKTENTHLSLSNMNEWRNQNISFKSIFFRRTGKGYLKRVDSNSSNHDIKDYNNFYQGLIIEFPSNLLSQSTIFNLQIMDYKTILNNTNNQHYENFDQLKNHIKQQQQLQQQKNQLNQQTQSQLQPSNDTVIDIDYNEHFIQNYYNFNSNSNNNNIGYNKSNSNMNLNYFSYHINDQE